MAVALHSVNALIQFVYRPDSRQSGVEKLGVDRGTWVVR